MLSMLWNTLHVKLLWIHPEDCQLSQVQKALFKLENQGATVVLTLLLLYMHIATETCVPYLSKLHGHLGSGGLLTL